jgi:glycyl-tRNA synthetase beta chain
LNKDLLQESAEKALYEAINSLSPEIGPLCDKGNYSEALQKLAGLRDVVDQFFEHVMVMADDEKIKNNRLALLQQLHAEFGQIADIALLQN